MKLLKYITFLSMLTLLACNQGIRPGPEITDPGISETGFGGTVFFVGDWPTDVTFTVIVLFKDPLQTADDFNIFNLKFLSDTISTGVSTHEYSSLDNILEIDFEPGEYSYLGVAQSKTPALSLNRADWFVSGLYYAEGDSTQPGKLTIPENTYVQNVDITVDFDNPPPQPPGGS